MCRRLFPVLIVGLLAWTSQGEEGHFSGVESEWEGYRRVDFEYDNRACTVIRPDVEHDGRPWIWRARFFGHEPQTDRDLLSRGFHLVYMDVSNLYGNPEAVAHWDGFYAYLVERHGFAKKVALEGMSRGGLIVYNWASANPDKVACIYADAPVCDIRSWPGGKGAGDGSRRDWRACLDAYGLTEETADAFRGNPIDGLEPLAKAGVPLLHVCGVTDLVVPVEENTAILAERYRALGGTIEVILKEGVGHHPHSLEDPRPIVDFILTHTIGTDRWYQPRGGFENARIRFEREKSGRVAFLGGSITQMPGWRDGVGTYLEQRFPETAFEFINAGIASTDSTLGAFRLEDDAFRDGPVDLLFVEFAVNDQHNERQHEERMRGMEGILRRARELNPYVDILVQYCADPDKMELFRSGRPDPVIVDHEIVCRYYGITSNDLAREVTDRIDRGEFTWEQFGGLHPGPFGHDVYTASIGRLLDDAWPVYTPAGESMRAYPLPEPALDAQHYGRGRYLTLESASLGAGWELVPRWNKDDGASKRPQFTDVPMLEATEPGAELRLEFEGTAVGLLIVAGPDVGVLSWKVDDGDWQQRDPFTRWSDGLHIPWAFMLETELPPGKHRLTLKTTDEKNEESVGYAARIVRFLAN